MGDLITPLGARVSVVDHNGHVLGPGVLLRLSMVDPADPRIAEVYLDPQSASELAEMLIEAVWA